MSGHVVALCGGVGGAKLVYGLAQMLPPERLTVIVNTGDDFEHVGLSISPDIDTVVYKLAGIGDRERGWGLAGESWNFMAALHRLGGPDWFRLGDRDLATHVERTRRLREGATLSGVTRALCQAAGISHAIVPMSDDPVRTIIATSQGRLAFQHYFVRDRCEPVANAIHFDGATSARPAPAAQAALARADLAAIVICPSNPYLSIDPILAVPGIAESIRKAAAPCVAVSPIINGAAIKGPTAKLMLELGVASEVTSIARHYDDLVDAMLIDVADAAFVDALNILGIKVAMTDILMRSEPDELRVANGVLALAGVGA